MKIKKSVYNVRVIKSELTETKKDQTPMVVLGCEFTNQAQDGLEEIVGKSAGSLYLVASDAARSFGLDIIHNILDTKPDLENLNPSDYDGLQLAVIAKSEEIPELDDDKEPIIDQGKVVTRNVTRIDRVLRAAD